MTNNDEVKKAAQKWAHANVEDCKLWKLAAYCFLAGHAYATRWIPVSERLPEHDGERVLVYPVGKYYGEVLTFCKYPIPLDGVKANSFIWTCEEITYMEDITRWLPLPAAPKEVK